MKYIKLILLLCFLLTVCNSAHSQRAACRLMTNWVRKAPFQSSSNFLLGTFELTGKSSHAFRLFRHEESGANVSVGVDIVENSFDKEPAIIDLAIAFTGNPEGVFQEEENANASTIYDKHWKMLSVSKSITKGERNYQYILTCEKPRTKH